MSASIASTPSGSYAALRMFLAVLAVWVALAGLLLIFATNWLAGAYAIPTGPGAESVGFLIKAIGTVVLGLSYMTWCASRDPVRYVGIIDALIVTLVLVVALETYEIIVGNADRMFPHHLILWSAIARAALAIVLFVMRPRAAG
ncbi:MAG TPA: hypothetical protein VKF82_05490 [Candidatus Eremiobacteraceae bacterium]|nr:hypothetical protein [Candidatus Eremiobacteraceae bacterium]